ncbi:unnamed protein product, partial [Iphiclides podalirius]
MEEMRFSLRALIGPRVALRARNERSSTPTDSIAMTGWKLFRINFGCDHYERDNEKTVCSKRPLHATVHGPILGVLTPARLIVVYWRKPITGSATADRCDMSPGAVPDSWTVETKYSEFSAKGLHMANNASKYEYKKVW